MMERDIEGTLAEFSTGFTLGDVAPEAVQHAKLLLVDAIGCALTGDLAQETAWVQAVATVAFGDGEATVIGSQLRLSEAGATMLNSYLTTAMTVCDVYRPAHCHMTPLVIPPALAVAENGDVSGEGFLTAVILGMETMTRVALGLDYPAFRARGWHSPGVVGPFGAAAAVGRIRGFDAPTMENAFGLAATQSAGSYLSWGTPAVKFHQARGAVSGLLAARLAERGFPGGKHPLTADDGGLYNTHTNGGHPAAVVAELGNRWELEQIAIRLWPGASPVQAMLTAVFDVISSDGVGPDDVVSLEIGISTEDYGTHSGFDRPKGTFEALLSYAYLCSVVLHDRRLWFEQVRSPRLEDEDLLGFAEDRITLGAVDNLPVNGCQLSVYLADGRRLNRRVETAKGTPENPATESEVTAKFHRAADPKVGHTAAEELIRALMDIESLKSIDIIYQMLRGKES